MTYKNIALYPIQFVESASPNGEEERKRRREEYRARIQRNDEEQAKQIDQYLRGHPQLAEYCHVDVSRRSIFTRWDERNIRVTRRESRVLISADSTPTEHQSWIVEGWIPAWEITEIVGHPNSGKSTLAITFAAALSQGENMSLWQGASLSRCGGTIISSTEEKFASMSKPKFIAGGGDVKSLHCLNGIPEHHRTIPNNVRRFNFSEEDYAILRREIKGRNIEMMILDPISQVVSGYSGNNAKDRNGYEKLSSFIAEEKITALGIGHTPKSTKGKSTYARIAGSGAAAQVVRSIIMVVKINGGPLVDGATHVMVLVKAAGAPVNYGVTFSIADSKINENGVVQETPRIVWHDTIPGIAEEILAKAESGGLVTDHVNQVDVAVYRLKEALKDGPQHGTEIELQIRAAGTTVNELKKAKTILNIRSYKQKGAGKYSHWLWSLPPSMAE